MEVNKETLEIIKDFENEQSYTNRFVVMGIVNGSHYDLSWKNYSSETSYEEAQELMLIWKESFNKNKPFMFSAKIGGVIDIIRTDTIEKMYIRKFKIQKDPQIGE